MDYSQLSDQDLLALKSGDYTKLSDKGLLSLKGQSQPPQPDPIRVAQNLQSNTMSMNPNIPMPAPVNLTGNVPSVSPNEVGHNIASAGAEELAKRGMNPYASAALTLPVSMAAPTAEMGYNVAMMGGPKGIADAVTSLGRGAADVAGNGVNKLRNLARILTGPGETAQQVAMQPIKNAATGFVDSARADLSAAQQVPQSLTAAKQELAQTPANMADLATQRQALVTKAGKNIQSLEAPLGDLDSAKINQLVSDQGMRQATLKDLTKITAQGTDAINAKMTARDIQQMRQFVQEVARNPDLAIEAPQASQINSALGQAMDQHIPGYKDALELYKTSQEALEDVPNIKAQQLGQLRSRIKDMQDAFTNSKLDATDALKKAQMNAKQIMQKADMMVQQGKLSDVYRQRLYKGIVATGILGGVGKLAQIVGGH